MTSHHPEYEQLVDYTAGSLHPSVTLAVSVHLEYCADCRREVRRLEALGGALLETLQPLALPRCAVGPGVTEGRSGMLLLQGEEFLAGVDLAQAA